jgi:hypothetical protein
MRGIAQENSGVLLPNISLQRTSHDKVHVTRGRLRAAELGRYIPDAL